MPVCPGCMLHACADAAAVYHPTAVGIFSRLPRQPPPPEDDNTIVNTAILYAAYRFFLDTFPVDAARYRDMMVLAGLDPDNDSECAETAEDCSPVEIGNAAGNIVVAAFKNDGWNSVGLVGRTYNPKPFRDYTGCATHLASRSGLVLLVALGAGCCCTTNHACCSASQLMAQPDHTLQALRKQLGPLSVAVYPCAWFVQVRARELGVRGDRCGALAAEHPAQGLRCALVCQHAWHLVCINILCG